jgi:hypothetical protein
MVDPQARDTAAKLLQAFIDGTISNYKYDHGFPRSKSDPALRSVWANLWFYYSDIREHTLTGKDALTPGVRALYERSLLFLKSDLEFQWPPPEFKLIWPSPTFWIWKDLEATGREGDERR